MKTQPTLLWAILLLITFGCDDLPIGFENTIGSSVLSGKPPVLKISYTEVAQRKAESQQKTLGSLRFVFCGTFRHLF